MKAFKRSPQAAALAYAAALVVLSASVQAQQIPAGNDCWVTSWGSDEPTQLVFDALRTIAPDFFGAGSLPIPNPIEDPGNQRVIPLRGNPLDPLFVSDPNGCGCPEQVEFEMTWVDMHGVMVGPNDAHKVRKVDGPPYSTEVDTCVRRTQDVNFSGTGIPETIEIELIALSLKSIQPLPVAFDTNGDDVIDFIRLFDVFVHNSGLTQPAGMMRFEADEISSGAVMSGEMDLLELPITFEVEFREHEVPSNTFALGPFNLMFGESQGGFRRVTIPSMIPTLGTWGLILLAMALMTAGAMLWKRREHEGF